MKNKEIIIIKELSNKYRIIDNKNHRLSCSFCYSGAEWKIGYKIDVFDPVKYNLQLVCNDCKDNVILFLNKMEEIINWNIKDNPDLNLKIRDEIIFEGLIEHLTKNFKDINLYDTHIKNYWDIVHKYWNPLNVEWDRNYE